MNKDNLEPGLLRVFDLYFVARLSIILVSAFVYVAEYGFFPRPRLAPYAVLFVGDLLFLFVFLSWSWLRRHLGQLYLPIALGVASAIPIIEARYLYGLYEWTPGAGLWLVFPFLSVPLILVAWQYGFRQVMIYCLGTALFEAATLVLIRVPGSGLREVWLQAWAILPRTIFFMLVGYTVSNLVAIQRRQRHELAEANRSLVRQATVMERLAVSHERNRLARELHDTLAHTLSGLAVQLEAIATLWEPNPLRARAMLERALAATRAGLEETRRALQDLRATPIEDLGLPLAVRHLAEGMAQRSNLTLKVAVSEDLGNLAPEVEQCYYRVAQEALENVARHAGAGWVAVSLQHSAEELVLEVADDGRGFAAQAMEGEDQFGLQGMRERAAMIGADLRVLSRPDQGTTVRLSKRKRP